MPKKDRRFARLLDLLSSRPVGALAGGTLALIFLGCMSLSLGGLSIGCRTEPDGTVCEEGKVELHSDKPLEVYYPIPFASPPNLELSGDTEHCEIIEQQADHFRVQVRGHGFDVNLHWQARGLRGVPPVSAPPVVVPSPPATVPPPKEGELPSPVPLPAPTPERVP